MKPYYDHAGITIYHGDCRDFDLHPDSIITDPVWPNCPAGLLVGSDDPFALFAEWCRHQHDMGARATFVLRHDSDQRFLVPVNLPYGVSCSMVVRACGYSA